MGVSRVLGSRLLPFGASSTSLRPLLAFCAVLLRVSWRPLRILVLCCWGNLGYMIGLLRRSFASLGALSLKPEALSPKQ